MSTGLPQVARVAGVRDDTPAVRTLVLDRSMAAEPGQFVMAWLPGVGEKPFSLVWPDPVTLTVARVGPFTRALHALAPGDRLWLRGPLGRGFTLPTRPAAGALLLIAGGYGVAPLCFLARCAAADGWRVSAVAGARTARDLVLTGDLAAAGARVVVATDDGSAGYAGLATGAAESLLAAPGGGAWQTIYACGPEPMLAAVERLARAHHLPAQLSYERMMRCAFGVCGSCSRDGWLVCKDGPVKRIEP